MSKWVSPKKYPCDRCNRLVPAYYILSHLAQGLWLQCSYCGTHARSYIPNLDLPYKPSKAYKKMKSLIE